MEAGKEGLSSSSYYSILGVSSDSSFDEIRRAYHKLAMQWHPDRWARTPSLLGEAKRKFQQIQEAYSVLSDHKKRTMYDAGLYDPQDEEDEGLFDFVEEMVSLMAQVKREVIHLLKKFIATEEFFVKGLSIEMALINEYNNGCRKRITVWKSCRQCLLKWLMNLSHLHGTVGPLYLMNPGAQRGCVWTEKSWTMEGQIFMSLALNCMKQGVIAVKGCQLLLFIAIVNGILPLSEEEKGRVLLCF